jgi:hypothetical protein
MNYLLEGYLTYLHEKEWNDPDDPGTHSLDLLQSVVSKLTGSGDLAQQRQAHQPNMLNVYIKRALGDYRGRADTLNTYRFKNIGMKDWDIIKKVLKKAYDHEKNIHPEKALKNIMTVQNFSKEPLGREIGPDGSNDDGYSDGPSGSGGALGGGL